MEPTTNNVFRKEYRELNKEEKDVVNDIKDKAQALWDIFHKHVNPNNAREMALAKTHLEDSVMRAVKGITG